MRGRELVNILHVLSQTHLTGPEVYVASLCRRQIRDGHRVLIVSDTLTVRTAARYLPLPIHRRRPLQRIRNIIKLVRLCRREHIDLVHAHSRAASWLVNIVRFFAPIVYVSTVHGRQSVHASSRRGNVYGAHIMAVCEHIRDHLRAELNIRRARIHVVRNGID